MRISISIFASILVLAALAAPTLRPAHAADSVPQFNISANCRAEIADGSAIGETVESCTADEQQAKDQLSQTWSQYSRDDKTSCIKETSMDGTPSYVELQTCLEMSAGARARRGGVG